jgi:hypothetical protein
MDPGFLIAAGSPIEPRLPLIGAAGELRNSRMLLNGKIEVFIT